MSDRANMDVLKMEQAIEQSLSQAMTGLCDQFAQQVVNTSNTRQEKLQGNEEGEEHKVPFLRADVPGSKGGQERAASQQHQHLHDVSKLRIEVESLRGDLRKLSRQASSSADFKVADAASDKVRQDVQVLLNALQARMSSEISNAVGQLRGELGLVKADVASTAKCLQHVEGEFRSMRAKPAFEQFTGRLTAVEHEVQKNSKTLSHVGDILKVTHEITTGSDKMIGRMSYEVSTWRETESRLDKRLLLLEQRLHQLGSVAMQNAEQQSETRKANQAEQAKDVELRRSADLMLSLESSLGKLNDMLQAPTPKFIPAGFQQQSPIGICTQARSPPPLMVNGASCPGTTIPSHGNLSSPVMNVQRRSLLAASSRHSDGASISGSLGSSVARKASFEIDNISQPPPANIHQQSTSIGGFSVIPRQAALSAAPVAHQA